MQDTSSLPSILEALQRFFGNICGPGVEVTIPYQIGDSYLVKVSVPKNRRIFFTDLKTLEERYGCILISMIATGKDHLELRFYCPVKLSGA